MSIERDASASLGMRVRHLPRTTGEIVATVDMSPMFRAIFCTQLGDRPVFLRLGSKKGALHHVLRTSRNPKTAIFQRFGICMPEWPASASAPTGRYARFLTVVASRGRASSRPAIFAGNENGGIPTIYDFDAAVICVQASPNWKIGPFLAVGAEKVHHAPIFYAMRKEAMRDPRHKMTAVRDSAPGVLILGQACGF